VTSHQVQELLLLRGVVIVCTDIAATTGVTTSCGENLLIRVDGLAVMGDENHIRRLIVVVQSIEFGVSDGSTSKEASFSNSLPERSLVAGFDAVERRGVGFSLKQSGVAPEASVEKEGRENEKK
jgi:hypothetical protein